VVLFGATDRPPIEHLGMWTTDRALVCAGKLFEKPVVRSHQTYFLDEFPCPDSKQGFIDILNQKLLVSFESDDFVYLMPSQDWVRDTKWRRLRLVSRVKNWETFPGSRNLPTEEQEQIRKVIFKVARTAPVAPPWEAGPDGDTAMVENVLCLDVHRLSPEKESVIAIWGQESNVRRLVYGELSTKGYAPKWDSPLFDGLFLELGYKDMDGDGVKEILLWSDLLPSAKLLTVFDRNGRELTRQAKCEIPGLVGYDQSSGVCPIVGGSMHIDDPQPDGKRDLLVEEWIGAVGTPEFDVAQRFRLVDGRYVHCPSVKAKKAHARPPSLPWRP
jgi:hypothetical protein